MKQKPQNPNDLVKYFNKVQDYIRMEYSEELSQKMSNLKYVNISTSYVKNCLSLNKTVPYIANGIVKFLTNTK